MNRLVRDKNLKESAIHRSGKLPLKIYADDYVRYHWHDEYEFLLSEGDGVRCTVSGVQIELKTGCALLIQAGDLHAISSAGPQEITEIVVHPSFWADGEDSELFAGKLGTYLQSDKGDPFYNIKRVVKRFCFTTLCFCFGLFLRGLNLFRQII